MQVSNSNVARPWKLEQSTLQASRQASKASRLWKLEQNNMTKKKPFFWSSKRKEKKACKKGLAQFKILVGAVAGQINASTDLPQ